MAISDEPDSESPEAPQKTSASSRLYSARLPLFVALVVLVLASLIWPVPLVFSLTGFAAILAVTAFAAEGPARTRSGGIGRRDLARWPDTSMKSVVNAIRSPAFVLDKGGIVRFANDAAAGQFPDTRPGDLLTLTFRSTQVSDALRAAAAGHSGQVQYRVRSDGGGFMKIDIDPLNLAGRKPEFILLTLHDMSEQIALARMRADFVANASHELRTPLTSLTGFVETLLGPARNDPDAGEKFLRIMLEQAERMRRLIDDLLSLSRVEMRAHSQPTDVIDLTAVLRHVCDALTPVAEENGVVINADLPDLPIRVQGDADELTQVFENLIENGLKYGRSGGKLDVTAEVVSDGNSSVARIGVRDYGPGIAEEHLPRLTERFYRVDVETSRQEKGTGLGLAIVKHIVAHHRGRLLIDSNPGEGAVFTVELPIAKDRGVDKKGI